MREFGLEASVAITVVEFAMVCGFLVLIAAQRKAGHGKTGVQGTRQSADQTAHVDGGAPDAASRRSRREDDPSPSA